MVTVQYHGTTLSWFSACPIVPWYHTLRCCCLAAGEQKEWGIDPRLAEHVHLKTQETPRILYVRTVFDRANCTFSAPVTVLWYSDRAGTFLL